MLQKAKAVGWSFWTHRSYNLHWSSSTEKSPFELTMGQHPMVIDEAKDSLVKAIRKMKKYANKGRRPMECNVGD